MGTWTARLWAGGSYTSEFPLLARMSMEDSGAGQPHVSESEAAPVLTYSSPLQGMLSRPLRSFVSAETSWLLLVDQFPSSDYKVSPRDGQTGWQVITCDSGHSQKTQVRIPSL